VNGVLDVALSFIFLASSSISVAEVSLVNGGMEEVDAADTSNVCLIDATSDDISKFP
jgi:hypothetical protein